VVETIEFLRALWRGESSFDGRWAGFSDVGGVSTPQPPCPIIVGANGPKLAALVGRHADGLNLHSWETDIAGLVEVAQQAAADAGRPSLSVSVEGPLEPDWLDERSATRRTLSAIGVDEVMLRWNASLGLDALTRS